MARTTKVVYFDEAEREIVRSPEWRERMQEVGDRIASAARRRGPVGKPTHGGTASISAVTRLHPRLGWVTRVSWDKRHYYMTFPENGTVYQPERPFLRPALRDARDL